MTTSLTCAPEQSSAAGGRAAGTIRVLHVLPALAGGGMERAAVRLIGGTPAHGPIAHGLCILKDADRALLTPCGSRVRVWILDPGEGRMQNLSCWWRLRRVIQQFRPDIVHARSTGVWPDAVLATAGLNRVRLLLSFHGKTTLAPLSFRRVLLNRWAVARADGVVTVSRQSAAAMQEEWGVPAGKLTVIHNGVDLEQFQPDLSGDGSARMRAELGLRPDARVVICVANLLPVKGIDVLLRAWQRVVARQPAASLLLVGDGPLRGELQALTWNLGCRESVLFAGARENVAELLCCGDLFVLPSRYEACSNAILEAMAAGLPVVACDTGGNRELITPEQNGWLVRPDAPEDLAACILARLADDEGCRRAGAAARRAVVAEHGHADWVERYLAFYRRLAFRCVSQDGSNVDSECASEPPLACARGSDKSRRLRSEEGG